MISTKARYALRVMLDLAQQPSDQYIPLKAIAQRQQISEKYLEIILKNLVKAQFLKGVRGKGGGYMLTKKPEEYLIGEIIELTDGPLVSVASVSYTHLDVYKRQAVQISLLLKNIPTMPWPSSPVPAGSQRTSSILWQPPLLGHLSLPSF